ncbi:MAG: hypothetical protein ACPGED_01015 [Flavobacteriales bacterium]
MIRYLKTLLCTVLLFSFLSCQEKDEQNCPYHDAINETESMIFTLIQATYQGSDGSCLNPPTPTSNQILSNLDWLAFNCCEEKRNIAEWRSRFLETDKLILKALNFQGTKMDSFIEIYACSDCTLIKKYLRKKREEFMIIHLLG